MKQQFLVARGEAKTDLLIREFAELEKNETSLVGEHVFKVSDLKKAAQAGLGELITRLRTADFFPPAFLAEKLAQGVMEMLKDAGKESVEVLVDDMTVMKDQEADFVDDELDDDEDIDELLEDDEIPFEDESDEEEEEDLS
ncbi:hypothetical protein [Desulfosudis oleivorans]|uniref:Uncharacterized protein n=1 Tax=Desulfosudis oleivorans (strain DSM 6200 / JCM 39069 / Hxd3) TaxID=96561 RepID=A9A0A0_DESOH|nr:hypothetical protein [Desulfosudis oleivorans]ABW69019.1 hypothetical protein Dole_3216 [Desulfosudis oleivorans Hxd3]